MTIAEATQLCDDQCTQLTTFASQSAAATNGIKETKPLIGSRKRAIEKLESGRNALVKEEDEWRRRGANDERTEEGCRWFVFHSQPFLRFYSFPGAVLTGDVQDDGFDSVLPVAARNQVRNLDGNTAKRDSTRLFRWRRSERGREDTQHTP